MPLFTYWHIAYSTVSVKQHAIDVTDLHEITLKRHIWARCSMCPCHIRREEARSPHIHLVKTIHSVANLRDVTLDAKFRAGGSCLLLHIW